ncbi:MAG: sel1 repeat family protein [Zoogloeaceae bacterium]|jgi:TPR repeat protein|nr:sel1 repeat family protein [Zoogloeaceae bacterium]
MQNIFRRLTVVALLCVACSSCAPRSPDVLFNEAEAAYEEEDYAAAAKLYDKACDGGHFRACGALGFMYDHAEGVKEDHEKAARLYQKACDNNDIRGCNNLGISYDNGEGVEQDKRKAASLYEKSCNAGLGDGCNNLGMMYDEGVGVEKNAETANALHEKAFAYFEQACVKDAQADKDNDLNRCYNKLAADYDSGEQIKQDYTKVARLYEKSCNNGSGGGCNHLADLYVNGVGVSKDLKKAGALREQAFTHHEQACEGKEDVNGCYNATGAQYESGDWGFEHDDSKAARLYEKSCNHENGAGCNKLGLLYEAGKLGNANKSKAKALYAKAFLIYGKICDGEDHKACHAAAANYATGDDVPQDYAKAAALYEKSCNKTYGKGCDSLGDLYKNGEGVQQNPEKANELYARALRYDEQNCAANNGEACFRLGERTRNDDAKAFLYYQKACTYNDADGCTWTGLFHSEGKGGAKKDKDIAVEFFIKGCEMGSADACGLLIFSEVNIEELEKLAASVAGELKKELQMIEPEP